MFEMSVTDDDGLRLIWSNNEGMKCRCDFNTEILGGIALRQCYGTMVSSTSSKSCDLFSASRMRFGKATENVAISSQLFPLVGDARLGGAIHNEIKRLEVLDSNAKKELFRSITLFASNFVLGRLQPKGEDSATHEWDSVSEDFSLWKNIVSSI